MNTISKIGLSFTFLTFLSGCGLGDFLKGHPRPAPPPPPPVVIKAVTYGTYPVPLVNAPVDLLFVVDLRQGTNLVPTFESDLLTLVTTLTQTHVDFHLAIVDACTSAAISTPIQITQNETQAQVIIHQLVNTIAINQLSETAFDPNAVLLKAGEAQEFNSFFRSSANRIYFTLSSQSLPNSLDQKTLSILDHQTSPGLWTLFSYSSDSTGSCTNYLSDSSGGASACGLSKLEPLFGQVVPVAQNSNGSGICFRDIVPQKSNVEMDHLQVMVNGNDWSNSVRLDSTRDVIWFGLNQLPPRDAVIQIQGNFSYTE